MARTTATKVKQIINTDLSDDIVDAYIVSANAVVTEALGNNTTITDTLKEEIERWLTAHYIAATREQQISKAEAGPTSVMYQGKTGFGLDSTLYGQQVKAMDSTGNLAKLGGKKASMVAIETRETKDWNT